MMWAEGTIQHGRMFSLALGQALFPLPKVFREIPKWRQANFIFLIVGFLETSRNIGESFVLA